MQTLDELLRTEAHGTFHDATVLALQHDAVEGNAALTADLCVGDPDAATVDERERRRRGRLLLKGVRLWRHDTSDSRTSPLGEWLTAEGPLAQAATDLGQALQREFGKEPYGWYFYFSDTNCFLYWTAQDVNFEWAGSSQPAA